MLLSLHRREISLIVDELNDFKSSIPPLLMFYKKITCEDE